MSDFNKLQELLQQQQVLAGEIAAQTATVAGDTLMSRMKSLEQQNEKLLTACQTKEDECRTLIEENRNLKESLNNQLHAERSRLLRASDARMAAYFGNSTARGENSLTVMEKNAKARFSQLRQVLDGQTMEVRGKFDSRLLALEAELASEIKAARESYRGLEVNQSNAHRERTAFMDNRQMDDRAVDNVARESDHRVERMVGISILGKIGAVIIIIGMIALAQWAYTVVDAEWLRCLFLFSVATVVLGFALFLNRKKEKRTPFTITILSLGVALEYTALSISYFTEMLPIWPSLGICVAITAVTYVIALMLKSEVVTIFAQIGGYLPVIAIYGEMNLIYGAMVYFLILNALGFVLSVRYKWQILNYISFGFNVAAIIFISISVAVMYSGQSFNVPKALTLVYILVSFIMHTVLPLVTNIRNKTTFTRPELIIMAVATTVNLVLSYIMFALYGIRDYSGWLSIFFAAFYFGIYFVARKFFTADTYIRTLFWLTGIVLLGLFLPMHFGDMRFVSFGWVLEAAVLIIYSLLRPNKFMFWTGIVIAGAALFDFLLFDAILQMNFAGEVDVFIYKYLMLTLASIAVLATLIYKNKIVLGYKTQGAGREFIDNNVTCAQVYAAAVYVNTAGFFMYTVWKIFDAAAGTLIQRAGNIQYLMLALMVAILFAFAIFVPKFFKAYAVHRTSMGVAVAAIIFLIVVNSIRLPEFDGGNVGGIVAAVFMTVIITLISGYGFFDLYVKISQLTERRNILSGLIIALSSYLLFWFTHLCLVQYRLSFTNLTFGIAYMVIALACLALGLRFRSTMTRRFALAVAGVAIFKLFVIDSFTLDLIYRIICYFAFGIILIGMSFLYQLFYKKMIKNDQPTTEVAQILPQEEKENDNE